jgi:hypothetical protein
MTSRHILRLEKLGGSTCCKDCISLYLTAASDQVPVYKSMLMDWRCKLMRSDMQLQEINLTSGKEAPGKGGRRVILDSSPGSAESWGSVTTQ